MDFKAFIFDMDGVLLDTESISFETWVLAGEKYHLDGKEIDDLNRQCMGTNRDDTIHILKNMFGSDFDASGFLEETSRLFHDIEFSRGIPLMPYARECLQKLKEKGARLALASSTRAESVHRQLKNAGLFDFFEVIITGDMVTHSKPNPEIYTLAVQKLGLKVEECAGVEDSPNGVLSAKSAGLYTIMVPDRIQPTKKLLESVDLNVESLEKMCEALC